MSKALTFEQGYVCAVATMLRQHGETVYARDLLQCIEPVNWKKIPPCDREIIEQCGLMKSATAGEKGEV